MLGFRSSFETPADLIAAARRTILRSRRDFLLMDRRIVGFHQDDEQHWVAELECGHGQHVRHDPPWRIRDWVTSLEGRTAALGTVLNCRKCDAASADGRDP